MFPSADNPRDLVSLSIDALASLAKLKETNLKIKALQFELTKKSFFPLSFSNCLGNFPAKKERSKMILKIFPKKSRKGEKSTDWNTGSIWKILQNTTSLWVQIVRSKIRTNSSITWKNSVIQFFHLESHFTTDYGNATLLRKSIRTLKNFSTAGCLGNQLWLIWDPLKYNLLELKTKPLPRETGNGKFQKLSATDQKQRRTVILHFLTMNVLASSNVSRFKSFPRTW